MKPQIQITFTTGTKWRDVSPADNLARAHGMACSPYNAEVRELVLEAHFHQLCHDDPFRERAKAERVAVVDLSLSALARYCSDHGVDASMVTQTHWDKAADGSVVSHHLFIHEGV